jgi:acyl-CoA thioester hydrolase
MVSEIKSPKRKDAFMSVIAVRNELPSSWHAYSLRVPLYEVDLGQAVYHGNYFHLFELARESFFRDLGFPYRRFMEQELHLTIVDAVCSYRRPIHYDETVEIHTAVLWWRRRSLAVSQVIYRDDDGGEFSLCTRVTLNMVCVRFTGQATVLPEDFVIRLKSHPLAGEAMERNRLSQAMTPESP